MKASIRYSYNPISISTKSTNLIPTYIGINDEVKPIYNIEYPKKDGLTFLSRTLPNNDIISFTVNIFKENKQNPYDNSKYVEYINVKILGKYGNLSSFEDFSSLTYSYLTSDISIDPKDYIDVSYKTVQCNISCSKDERMHDFKGSSIVVHVDSKGIVNECIEIYFDKNSFK